MKPLTDRDRRLVCLWLAGAKLTTIKAEFGLRSHSWVSERAHKLGLPPRLNGKRGIERVNLWPCIVAWAKAGYTAEEIAIGIGCTKTDFVASIRAASCLGGSRETKEQFRQRLIERIKAMKRNGKRRLNRRAAAKARTLENVARAA